MSAIQSQQSTARARTQARKKTNDDAAYLGPSNVVAVGSKRQATERADGEQGRMKRKRVDVPHVLATSTSGKKDIQEGEPPKSLVEFQRLPLPVLYRYLTQFDIVPLVYPSPLGPEDPPSPGSLADSQYQTRQPSPPPTNRPRREPRDSQGSRRRSSRLLEEENRSRVPILPDIAEVHSVLASIAERHFRETAAISGREEVDTLAAFMCAVEKTKGGKSKVSA